MCRLTHVNIIKRTDTWNCSASTASSEKCQYVMVSWSFYNCVTTYSCERNSMQKHLYLFSIEPSSDMWQYVMVFMFACQCVEVDTCQQKTMKKQSETLSNEPMKCCVAICGGLFLSISVCGCRYLLTDHNEETIGTVVHLSHQEMSVNMC